MFWPLFKIFLSNIFSFGAFIEGFKKGVKGVLKNILIILVSIYCVGVISVIYVLSLNNIGTTLKESGTIMYMPIIILISALLVVFFFGFVSAASNYYTGCGEEQFLAMPFKPVDIFGAKVGLTAITDVALGAFLLVAGSIIFGIKAGLLAKPLFYVGMIASVLGVSTIALLFIYVLLIFILLAFKKLRNKGILTGIASFLIIVLVMCYSLFSSLIGSTIEGTTDIGQNASLLVMAIGEKIPWIMVFSNALAGNIVSILIMLAIFGVGVFGIIPLLAPLYIKTLNGFSDVKSKKISVNQAQTVLKKETKRQSVFKALYIRDLRTLYREPSYFANGPLLIFLMPVIMIISFVISFTTVSDEALGEVRNSIIEIMSTAPAELLGSVKYWMVLIASLIVVFLGNSTSIGATSFSREGKALYDLKAMPIENDTIVSVKFWHAITYCVISYLVVVAFFIAAIILFTIPFSVEEIVSLLIQIFIISAAGSVLLVLVDMFLDTVNPKLLWENPTAAFKQNVNAIIAVFITMGVVGLSVVLAFFVPRNVLGIVIITVVYAIIAAPLGICYFKYANKKLIKM